MHAIDSSSMVYTFIVYVCQTSHVVIEKWSMLQLFMFDDAWSLWSVIVMIHDRYDSYMLYMTSKDVRCIYYQSIMHHIKTCYWYTMYFDKSTPSTLQIIYVINGWCMINLLSIHDPLTACAFNTYWSSIHNATHACHRIQLLLSHYALCISAIGDVCYQWYGPDTDL